jgi:hypothetical protein
MMMIRTILSFLLLIPLPFLHAQQKDFQFWPSAQVSVLVIDNLKFHFEEELRLIENATQAGRQINDLGFTYRFGKYLKTSLNYRFESKQINPGNYHWRQGFYADIALKYDIDRFTLGYRARFQSAKLELNREENYPFEGFKSRHKISFAYDIKGLPLAPFIEDEFFLSRLFGKDNELIAFRTWLGIMWLPGKIHEITLKYGIDKELHVADPITSYIMALQYTVNLSLH